MSEYIGQLRSLVGTRPLVLPGAAVIISDARDRILMLRRADNGDWTIPGGFLEPGESTEDTARRETREETGLRLGALTLLGVFSGKSLYHRYPNGDEVYNVTVLYGASQYSGHLRADGAEISAARFFAKAELPYSVVGSVRPILADVLRLNTHA